MPELQHSEVHNVAKLVTTSHIRAETKLGNDTPMTSQYNKIIAALWTNQIADMVVHGHINRTCTIIINDGGKKEELSPNCRLLRGRA